jgi:hypothetical protein
MSTARRRRKKKNEWKNLSQKKIRRDANLLTNASAVSHSDSASLNQAKN